MQQICEGLKNENLVLGVTYTTYIEKPSHKGKLAKFVFYYFVIGDCCIHNRSEIRHLKLYTKILLQW